VCIACTSCSRKAAVKNRNVGGQASFFVSHKSSTY